MAHVADLDLTVADIGGLSSLDALAGFFTRLGYPTGCRKELPAAYLDGLQAKVDRLKVLQEKTAAELDALLPAILDKGLKGDL